MLDRKGPNRHACVTGPCVRCWSVSDWSQRDVRYVFILIVVCWRHRADGFTSLNATMTLKSEPGQVAEVCVVGFLLSRGLPKAREAD